MQNQETEIRTKRNKQSLVMCQRLFQVLWMKILAQAKPKMQSPKTGLMKRHFSTPRNSEMVRHTEKNVYRNTEKRYAVKASLQDKLQKKKKRSLKWTGG
jgi:hypothetical protein